MAKTKKFEYQQDFAICITCDKPSSKRCKVCGHYLCNAHYKLGNGICESCLEDDNNYDDDNGLSTIKFSGMVKSNHKGKRKRVFGK